MNQLRAFFDERLGIISGWEAYASRRVLGGARLRHVFAPVMLYLFLQQAVLGTALAIYYSPSATDAWASTAYLQDTVMLGWFVRGVHYHTTSVMVILAAVWLAVVAFTRGYRQPWEFTWIAIMLMIALCLGLGITGNPLPWDQAGYWGIQVELGIGEQAPGGEVIRTLVQGGNDAGNLTLLRLYALHVFVLPVAFGLLLKVVFRQLAWRGLPPPDRQTEDHNQRWAVPYAPHQLFLDVLVMAVLSGLIIGLTVMTHGAELLGPADPTINFQARPEWYFLFLYKLRMFFEGPLEPVATMVIPGAVGAFVLAVPLIDRFGGMFGRILAMVGVGLVMVAVVMLTGVAIMSDHNDEEYQKSIAAAHKRAEVARMYAKEGVAPLGGPAVYWNDPQYKVKQLYKEHCQGCHTLGDGEGEGGPNLNDYSSRAWLSALVRNANDNRFFGNTGLKDEMDPYEPSDLPDEQLAAVVEYLVELMDDPTLLVDQTLAAKGKALWENDLDCDGCHEVEKGESSIGPTLWGHGNKAWVERVIRDSGQEDLFGDSASMPKFKDKLSNEDISDLAAFIVAARVQK